VSAVKDHMDTTPLPKQRPVIYIAGPYTNPDPVLNTHRIVQFANRLMDLQVCYPVVPHTTLLWHAICPRPVEDWYELDIAVMLRTQGVIRFPGASSGADAEIETAIEHGLPVFEIPKHYAAYAFPPVEKLKQWIRDEVPQPVA
jgi:hypothetical protein